MKFRTQLAKTLLLILGGLAPAFQAMAANTNGDAIPVQDHAPSLPVGNLAPEETWSVHGQVTNVSQWHPSFSAPYSGPNSLAPAQGSEETTDLTLFLGVRLWQGGELYINPEYDQGFGLSNTLGVAGYPSGEAYKVGAKTPYLRLPRAFLRQVFPLGGGEQNIESAANQLAGPQAVDHVTITAGKFSATDIFDTNTYAHDPRADFLNWAIVDAGAFDYAADAWGFTYGVALEWTQSWWTLRGGLFSLSKIPNTTRLDQTFRQHEWVVEWEMRHQILGRPGKLKLLGYVGPAHETEKIVR
jgi:high affinity Mn2+ porin